MKIKLVVPWFVKGGQQIVLPDLNNEPRKYTIKRIIKTTGRLTGVSIWRIMYDDLSGVECGVTFRARLGLLPAQKVRIFVDK